MNIFPAIDIKNGKCVRLVQGDFAKLETYGDNPVAVAENWVAQGAKNLHIIDLDGALMGEAVNKKLIMEMIEAVNVPIQFGGGVRDMKYVEEMVEAGVTRVILGTSALSNKNFLKEAIQMFGDKIAVSLDAKNGYVAVKGWTELTDVTAAELAVELESYGLKTVVYTDISKDGMMAGPNFEEINNMKNRIKSNLIASGGISTAEDVRKLKEMGIFGCVIGKALYTGGITLSDVL
ncbi:MAG: 1-(5-phosphoribosyl)-5-[(5-phosphoribosylamino)methylideneamino]imidazole-4-carboxamide isomerase [Bacillota bacterium]|nr:1-(5-phosphoribosyl)-5-[(5-phosphoribosylamino)methylideneamino]imidazole-4-carboxamide isomerase [Bacillota bacterium]